MNATQSFTWMLILPLAATPVVYLAGRVKVSLARWIALIALLATGVPLYFTGQQYLAGTTPLDLPVNAIHMRFDGISLLICLTVLVLGSLATLFSFAYMKGEEGEEKFFALLTAMIGTIIGLCCAGDLFNLWVWFEAMAITSYMLVSFYRDQQASLEAGFKYLVQSATGSILVILAIALVFGGTGTLDLSELPIIISTVSGHAPSLLVIAAGALFFIGFGVKSAIFPMHTWLPDAHSQAPSGISAMLSGIVIEAGLIAMLRSIGTMTGVISTWGTMLIAFGAINCIAGNLIALRQNQVKRLLAYSSISHIGYIITGIGIAVSYSNVDAAQGSFFHILTHAMGKGLAFLAAGTLLYVFFIANGKHDPLTRNDLNGASRRYPIVAFAFSVAVLSLGGLPPLAGFMSKWQIIAGAFQVPMQTQGTGMIWLAVFIAVNSVISLGYYAPLVNRIYRHEPSEAVLNGKPVSAAMSIPMIVLTLGLVVLGFWPSLVNWVTSPAAQSLLTLFGQ